MKNYGICCLILFGVCNPGCSRQPTTAVPVQSTSKPDDSGLEEKSDSLVIQGTEPERAEPLSGPGAPPVSGLAGKWLLTLAIEAETSQPWLIEISGKEGSYEAKIIDSMQALARARTSIGSFRQEEDQIQFDLLIDDQTWPFAGVVAGGRVRGTLEMRDRMLLAWLERTRLDSMKSVPASARAPGLAQFEAAQQASDPKELTEQLIQFAERQPESPLAFDALRIVFRLSRHVEATLDQLRELTEKYQALSKSWGRRWHETSIEHIAADLATADGPENAAADTLALEFAEAAKEAVPEDAPAARKQSIELAYAVALVRNNRAEEGKKLLDDLMARVPDETGLRFFAAQAAEKLADFDQAIDLLVSLWPQPIANRELERIWKRKHGDLTGLEERLDQVYLQRFPPLEVEPYAGRADPENNQVVVAELFTGTMCPPCVAADVAFEALGRTFKPTELVVLQYHLHVPGPDPMTNEHSLERAQYYRAPGTPFVLINGRETVQAGGSRQQAPGRYSEFRAAVEKQLAQKTETTLRLTAARDGDAITIDVSGNVAAPTDKLRLRIALVEEIVRFSGRNGVRLHHAVVRAMPGGAAGIPVSDPAIKHHATINLGELRAALTQELVDYEKQIQLEHKVDFEFPSKPFELSRLGVAALIQDDMNQQVIQAAFVPVEPASASNANLDSPAQDAGGS